MTARTLLERLLAETHASAYLARLGVTSDEARSGEARARLRGTEASVNRAGLVHGGAIATVMMVAAETAAASSERERHASELRIAMLNASFLDAVRAGTEVHAAAHVLRRGRDVIHVTVEARAAGTGPAAQALLAYGLHEADGARGHAVSSRAPRDDLTRGEPLVASPYMGSAGARVLEGGGEWTCMSLPCEPNEAVAGRVHDGAVVGLVDTCAAMAAFKSSREHGGGRGATVSISLAWAARTMGEMRSGARVIGRQGSLFTTEAEVWGADGGVHVAGLVCYRIPGAGT
jgi:uncharacterized protein (TIGR00369 family)